MRVMFAFIFICGLLLSSGLGPIAVAQDNMASFDTVPGTTLFEADSADAQKYAFLQQQIYRGESDDAGAELKDVILSLESESHRYHENLIVPLTLLGDTFMVQKDIDAALDQYDRARHVARVSYGLFDARQLAIVYREADAYRKLGDMSAAAQREEYAYEVMRRSYEGHDIRQIPGLLRLGNFYLGTFNYLAARSMLTRAMSVYTSNEADRSVAAIPILEGIAQTHLFEKFPPFYIDNSNDSRYDNPSPGLTTTDLESQHIAFNNFPSGEKALQKVIEIRRSQSPEDKVATHRAMVALADWHLMFERNRHAHVLYTHVYEEMAQANALHLGTETDSDIATDAHAEQQSPVDFLNAEEFFAGPILLYLPKPHNPRPPSANKRAKVTQGYVTLGFDVTPTGHVRKLKTLDSQPKRLMDFRVRRSMRLAIFRPQLINGVPVLAKAQTHTYRFDYFPLIEPNNSATDANTEQPSTDENSSTTHAEES